MNNRKTDMGQQVIEAVRAILLQPEVARWWFLEFGVNEADLDEFEERFDKACAQVADRVAGILGE